MYNEADDMDDVVDDLAVAAQFAMQDMAELEAMPPLSEFPMRFAHIANPLTISDVSTFGAVETAGEAAEGDTVMRSVDPGTSGPADAAASAPSSSAPPSSIDHRDDGHAAGLADAESDSGSGSDVEDEDFAAKVATIEAAGDGADSEDEFSSKSFIPRTQHELEVRQMLSSIL
jgi:hypothetical protein